jgi:hypothetical protein
MSSESADRSAARTRASDAEREEIAAIVRDAVGEGRLDIAEGDERLAAIYAAKYRDELAPFVADLPAGQALGRTTRSGASRGGSETSVAPGWGPGPWEYRRRNYPRYGGGARGVIAHTGFVVTIAAALTLLWVISGAHFFWPAIPLFFLVLGLGRHWRWATWRSRSYHDDRR